MNRQVTQACARAWRRVAAASIVGAAASLLGGCGGAPGGLHVGYHAEDPSSASGDDPTLGALHSNLPLDDGAFAAGMFFTYEACQARNVGTVSGDRSEDELDGSWSATIDGVAQSGRYEGSYDGDSASFKGTYTVAGGRQTIEVQGCTEYAFAARGTWELLPVGDRLPEDFRLTLSGGTVRWTNPPAAARTLVAVIDEEAALADDEGATSFQRVLEPDAETFDLDAVSGLVEGTQYIVAVIVVDDRQRRLAAASAVFVR